MIGMDAWTTLSAIAARGTSLRLGPLVSCISYRSPALLARLAADVDCLSEGKLVLGLGIGNNQPEYERMGLPMPSTRDRQQALAETIDIVRGIWDDRPFSYEGAHSGWPTPQSVPRSSSRMSRCSSRAAASE